MSTPSREAIIAANIEVHTKMADTYNSDEPHFRPENQAEVRKRLEVLRAASGPRLLDIGCGTGFVMDLAHDLFDSIEGVDVTQAMLNKVNLRNGKIKLHNCPVETMPFQAESFDAVSAYAFVHHVKDFSLIVKEVHRVMKPGARWYIDLEPNRLFWQAMVDLENRSDSDQSAYSAITKRQIESVLHTDDRVEAEFGIPKDTFNNAEYTKSVLGGIDPYEFQTICLAAGFTKCEIVFQWYMGQDAVMHGKSFELAKDVDWYLRQVLPMSAPFFKYLQFNVTK
jgi:ubiquinone/menaquinone biosynthesis C-methylase UbiE